MMEGWRVGLALGLPWLAGALWLRVLWRDSTAGAWPLALGYGYILGLLATTLLLRAQTAFGLPLNFVGPMVILAVLALAGGGLVWRRTSLPNLHPLHEQENSDAGERRRQILFALLLIGLSVRLAGLALEVWWRPLYPWDAWTTWTVRPRGWSELP